LHETRHAAQLASGAGVYSSVRRTVISIVVALALALALALAGLVVTSARAMDTQVCGPATARTLAQSSETRVFRRNGEVWMCSSRTRASKKLGAQASCGGSSGCGGIDLVRVSGRYVAFNDFVSDTALGDEYFTLKVSDARSGAVTYRVRFGDVGGERARLWDVVLSQKGRVAWVASHTAAGPVTGPFEVWRSPGCGRRVLDSSPSIRPKSLALRDGRLAWRDGNTTRRALLCT
jgi:hypothetical protein